MEASEADYNKKFGEMQKYIPFLENMIDRLRNVDKPRAPQLDKIQSLYNIVTNSKKKLKYETLIKCEEGLKKLYDKVGKGEVIAPKSIDDNRKANVSSSSRPVECSSAPASPSPPSTPEPLPKAPILIPTERKISPFRDIKPIADQKINVSQPEDHQPNRRQSHDKSHDKKGRHYDKHKHHTKNEDDFGIYNKGVLHKSSKKDNAMLSPPPSEPPLTSADLEDLLSDNDSKTGEQLDIKQLESIRAQLVNQINDLSESSPPVEDDSHKQVTPEKQPSTAASIQKAITCNKSKTPVVQKVKEMDNKFGNLLSSIDDQIFEQKKKDCKKADPIIKKDIKKSDTVKKEVKPSKTEDGPIKTELENTENQSENKTETPYVRLADKYHRKPRTEKQINDVEEMSFQEKAPGNITGRGLTMKELERFGGLESPTNFSPPHNNPTNVPTFPNDPRLKRLPPSQIQMQNPIWMQSQSNQNNQPQNPYLDLYSPGPPSTPQDPFSSRNTRYSDTYNNIPVPIQGNIPLMQNFNQNKNFHPQYNQPPQIQPQYDLSKMNPINYFENPNQYHSNNPPPPMSSNSYVPKAPLLSPPANQSPLYNMNQNMYQNPNVPPHMNSAPKVPPTNRPLNTSCRDPRGESRDPRRRAYDNRPETTDRYNVNRNAPRPNVEKKVFRGYDPRPVVRKKEPEKVAHSELKVDGIANIPVPGALNSFKIPKIKREETKVSDSDVTLESKLIEKSEAESSVETIKQELIVETKDTTTNVTQNPEISSNSNEETETKEKVEKTDSKEDLINNFVRKLCESGETDTFLAVLERLGETISKTRMKRIINSETDESDDEDKKKSKQQQEDKKQNIHAADSTAKDESTESTATHSPKAANKGKNKTKSKSPDKPGKAKRRNDLEMLQDDIRDMFICKGVLTATGQRMCRLLKEDQEDSFSLASDLDGSLKKNLRSRKDTSEDGTSRRTRLTRQSKRDASPVEIKTEPTTQRKTRLPRVLIEKSDFETVKTRRSVSNSSVSSLEEGHAEIVKPKLKGQRKANKSEILEETDLQDEEEVVSKPKHKGQKKANKSEMFEATEVQDEEEIVPKSKGQKKANKSDILEATDVQGVDEIINKPKAKGQKKGTKSEIHEETQVQGEEEVQKPKSKGQRKPNKSEMFKETEQAENEYVKSLFLKRNLKGRKSKETKERSKIILNKKIIDVIQSLHKTKDFSLEHDSLKSIFDNVENLNEDSAVEDEPLKTSTKSIKLGKRKKPTRRGRGWSSGVIKKKPKKTESEKDKEESTSEQVDETAETKAEEPTSDTKPAINYLDKDYFISKANKYECKLCGFTGKTIVFHYKSVHPTEEVLISRLSPDLAKACIDESLEKDYQNLVQQEETLKCNGYRRKRFVGYKCRFCEYTLDNDFAQVFHDHLASHTGENGFGCTMCKFTSVTKPSLRAHVSYSHPGKKFSCNVLYPPCKNYAILIGYICGECHYVQLYEKNVQEHIKRYHSDEPSARIYKINLSSIKNETVDKEKGEQGKKKDVEISPDDEESIVDTSVEDELSPELEEASLISRITQDSTTEEEPRKKEIEKSLEDDNSKDVETEKPLEIPKERELNVFVCPDDLPDEQKIQDERLKIMQEVAEAVCQTRRTSLQFLDTLKSKLEFKEDEKQETPESVDKEKEIKVVKEIVEKKSDKVTTSPNDSMESQIDSDESPGENSKEDNSPSSIDIPALFDNDDDLEAGLIDEVLNMENDWSKWSSGKGNTTMMNTIQRLVSVVKQSNDTSTPALPAASLEIKYQVGPLCAQKSYNSIQYSCASSLMCSFSTNCKDTFATHVAEKHLDFWDGECDKCENSLQKTEKLTTKDALEHLFTCHLELPSTENQTPVVKPVIRMRKLSGDKLSATMSPDCAIVDTESTSDLLLKNIVLSDPNNLEFKIQDVRSLNPDEIETTPTKSEKSGSQSTTSPSVSPTKLSMNKQMALKDIKILPKMLQPAKLAHIFKCMAKNCTFTTDESNIFVWHLNTVKMAWHLPEDWGLCPYCPETALTNAKRLETHILEEHGGCRFQCGYCFYRAASQSLVERHQCENHNSENFRVYQLDARTDYNEYKKQLPLKVICKPYICPFETCKQEIYLPKNFLAHVETHPDMETYNCKICGETRPTFLGLVRHYAEHAVDYIQCLYCVYSAEYEHLMKEHLGLEHPNQSPKVLIRKINPALNSVLKITEPTSAESILRHLFICNLDLKITHFSCAIPIPSTPTDLQDKDPSTSLSDNLLMLLNENETTNSTAKDTNFDEPIDDNDENSHLNELIESTLKETENGGKLNTDLDIFADLKEKETEHPKELDSPMINVESSDEDIQNQVDPMALEEDVKESTVSKEDAPKSVKDILNTGLWGSALYRCGTTNCDFATDSMVHFKDHLMVCDTSKDSSLFRCFHCKRTIKYAASLVHHIKRHGIARYSCSLCNHRAAVAGDVAKHMKEKHKISVMRTIPLDPFKTDCENDLFVVCPKGKSLLKQKNSSKDLQSDPDEVKTIFAPDEVDLLPRQPISPFAMKCALCSYATKVRTNMVRHLLFHSNSIAVPESAPVNPVPCLEKNEKMFDKMVNLANSSFAAESRMGGKTGEKPTRQNSLSSEELQDLPGFVPENKRFVCGANGCNYLTVDDSMLRCHFKALHTDESNYKCPHCDDNNVKDQLGVVSIDKIGIHLKMHDTRLYRCSHCVYYHYQKHVVERHLGEKHPDKAPYVHVIRELDVDGKDESVAEVPQEVVVDNKPWRCGLCKFKAVTRTEVIEHAKVNHAVKSQFMCSLCQYKCSYDKNFERHFISKHPGQPVDMISVYYKEETSVVETVATTAPEAFDTTPLWRRDMPRVRHIRGILFEETTKQVSPRKSKGDKDRTSNDETIDYIHEDGGEIIKKTKRQEVMVRRKSIVPVNDLELSETQAVDRNEDLSNRLIELNLSYSCNVCKEFSTNRRVEFLEHLCQEMSYEKFICTYCNKKSHSFDWMKTHLERAHGKPWKPEFIVSLTGDDSIESFILTEINEQEKELFGNDFKEVENLNEIFGCPSDSRQIKSIDFSSSYIDDETSIEYSSDYEEIDNVTKMSTIKKLRDVNEDGFVDPRQTHRNQCPHCTYFSKYPRDVTKHIVRHWVEQPYQCGHCDLQGFTVREIIKHCVQHHSGKYKVIKIRDVKDIKIREMQRNARRKHDDSVEFLSEKKRRIELPSSSTPNTSQGDESMDIDVEKVDEPPTLDPILNEDEISTAETKDIVYLCHFCPKQGNTVKAIYDHWLATHKEKFIKSSFKFRTFAKNEIPTRVRGRVLCKVCGYRGSRQNVLKHHRLAHKGQPIQIDEAAPPEAPLPKSTRINCFDCIYFCYSLVVMKQHYLKVHPNTDFQALFDNESDNEEYNLEAPSPSTAVKCGWCQEVCKNEDVAITHHGLFHSHLKFVITPLKPAAVVTIPLKYCCPECPHRSESHISMLEHLRAHVKPFICGYCDAGFRFPHHVKIHIVKKHPGLEPKFEAVEQLQQEFAELRNKLHVALDDGSSMLYSDYKSRVKRKADSSPEGSPSKLVKLNEDAIKKSPVAKKSTTFIPPLLKMEVGQNRVAKKSTTPHEKVVQRPLGDSTKEYSFYGRKPITDNSNITTTMNLGGTQMKVNISTLMQLTNMLPILRIADLKQQKMIL